ncbi:hypothetical protein OH76DRAFT_1490510 [Lentinus brumalis]|uniref:Uncharacterized protein n=1 Tax=Lentinus brumalis TaxID=2498619 RepID=A0A371CIT0_9APHY|nr:hypothetical protein OH76DRAFT_1490510 [Polyporus brumalis]
MADLQGIETDDDCDTTTTEWEYTCLHNMHSVVRACGGFVPSLQDILVIRPEYIWLRETIETGYLQTVKAVIVTGHPGIGKTVWLLYLLLHRLERKLPTAIHLFGDTFVIFDDNGATVRDAEDYVQMTNDYWALSDANITIRQPCLAFQGSEARIILASSPRPDRWKEWKKYHSGRLLVSDLPCLLDIGAIVRELGLDVAEAYRFTSKWGPCTRTILALLNASSDERASIEKDLTKTAKTAAKAICADPAAYAYPETQRTPSVGFTILFASPYRLLDPDTSQVVGSVHMNYSIPTIHLSQIFHIARQSIANVAALQLFSTLALHATARAAPAWDFEKRVHVRLSSNSQPLDIFTEHHSSKMQPSQRLLVGTTGPLGQSSEFSSFYWLPSTSNFSGVHGVLANRDNVYVVQATTADEPDSPVDGLRNVWAKFDRDVREQRVWHVVFVTNSKVLASRHAVEYAERLKGFPLGQHKEVNVWGCVL